MGALTTGTASPHPGAMHPAAPPSPWIGLIADTHGLLRPEALAALRGCAHLIHAGDIGGRDGSHADILETLAGIAPLTAVRGNNDRAEWAESLPETALVECAGLRIQVLHIQGDLALHPFPAGIQVVVSGHSHKPAVATRDGVLYVNPGSAGPRRFKLPVSVARLWREDGGPRARVIELAA